MPQRFRFVTAAAAVALFTLALAPRIAHAAHRRVAVLRLEFKGDVPENGKVFLSQRLIEGLAAADFQVFAGLVVTQLLKQQGARLEGCRAADCYREIAQRLGVEYLVAGTVEVDNKNYEVVLDLVGGRDGKSVGLSRDRCELCGIKEVGQQMDRQMLALREYAEVAAATAPSRYAIESTPAGAAVTIDGKAAGVTPMSLDVPAGSHTVALAAPGHLAAERSLEVESGTNGFLSIDLAPTERAATTPGSPEPVRRPWRTLGLGALIAGGVAAVAGGVVMYLDGQEVGCAEYSAPMVCKTEKTRETSLESGILFGAGGALMAVGGVMLYFGWNDGRSGADTAGPQTRTFSFGARGRF